MASKKKTVKKKAEVKKAKPVANAKALVKKKSGTSSTDNGADRQLVLSFPGTITPMALMLHPALEIEEWAPIGVQLRRAKEFLQFAIGDWLQHGEEHYGEMYVQAASDTGIPEETLMILKHVSSRVAPATRIKDLTWSHHREVAKFPPEEQARWLKKALDKGWSVRDLKDALKKAAAKDGDGQEDGEHEEGREQGPPTGEACSCCGSSPAPMQICARCAVVPAKALETVGIKGAIELLNRKPSKPQIEMLSWAYEYIDRPGAFDNEEAQVAWEARFEALGKTVRKADRSGKS